MSEVSRCVRRDAGRETRVHWCLTVLAWALGTPVGTKRSWHLFTGALYFLLQNYIQEIRNCSTKEQEKERVDKELGKVRKKYTSDKAMSGV